MFRNDKIVNRFLKFPLLPLKDLQVFLNLLNSLNLNSLNILEKNSPLVQSLKYTQPLKYTQNSYKMTLVGLEAIAPGKLLIDRFALNDWSFECSKGIIASQEEADAISRELKHPPPTMTFALNSLTLEHGTFELSFNTKDALLTGVNGSADEEFANEKQLLSPVRVAVSNSAFWSKK